MTDPAQWAEAAFRGCSANVGPLIGLEIEVGEISIETSEEAPSGDLAVLPLTCELNDEPLASLTLSSPLGQIVTIARRMLGEEPEKEGEPSEDDLDAIGEILNLMGGAVDQGLREHVEEGIQTQPLQWWRSGEAGGGSFEEGEYQTATVTISVPDGTPIELTLRFPASLFQAAKSPTSPRVARGVLLLGLSQEIQDGLRPGLESASFEIHVADRDATDLDETLEKVQGIVLSGEDEAGLDLCRSLRKGNHSWSRPIIVCHPAPDREAVIASMHAGATYVVIVPGSEQTVLRVLNEA